MTDKVRQLFSSSNQDDRIITDRDIEGLPQPVQRNLRYTGVIGRKRISTVRLRQKALFRLKPNQKPMPLYAKQFFSSDPPGFVWQAKAKMNPLMWVSGSDSYVNGKGRLVMKLWSFIRVVNAYGPKLDQGELLRYLSEVIWFPTAYLSEYITWEAVDDSSAKATISYGGITASAILYYDSEGRLIRLDADRYMDTDEAAVTQKWSTPVKQYAEVNGLKIPVKGAAVWHLPGGDFEYIDLEITGIEYDNPTKY